MKSDVRIVLADDHTLVRRSLASLLGAATGITVVADVGTTDEAVDAAIEHQPDVVVLDIDIPGVGCFEAAKTIRMRCPRTKVLFLSAHTHDRFIDSALSAGALGYVTKSEPPQTAIEAIWAVASGRSYFSPEVEARIVIGAEGASLHREPTSRAATLSDRELEVLRYIAKGMSKKEMAHVMHISVKTVENHSESLMKRLDIHDRVELARFAIREGFAEA